MDKQASYNAMSSEEDVGEAFEITEDDLANEFNPNRRFKA